MGAYREVVMEAVKKGGNALQWAREELRGDCEVVMEAVKNNGFALYYARGFREDREVVLEAIKNNVFIFEYISDDLRSEIVSHWIKHMEKTDET